MMDPQPTVRPVLFDTFPVLSGAVCSVGDVRVGSMKRVAAAAGEGASAIPSIHRALVKVRPPV